MFTKENILSAAKSNAVYVDTPCYSRNGKYRMLMSPCTFLLSDGRKLSIEAGMYWDENSIPYIFQWAFPKSGMYAVATLVHDALYFNTTTSQRFADDEFKYWMKALEVSKWQVFFRYWAVRLFGWLYWNKNVNNPSERCLRNRNLIKITNAIFNR